MLRMQTPKYKKKYKNNGVQGSGPNNSSPINTEKNAIKKLRNLNKITF